MLRPYIWGYLNQVRSSRQLERACVRDLEALWLMRRLAPDYRTIASFRHDNPKPLSCQRCIHPVLPRNRLDRGRLPRWIGRRCARSRAQRTSLAPTGWPVTLRTPKKEIAYYLERLDIIDAAQWPVVRRSAQHRGVHHCDGDPRAPQLQAACQQDILKDRDETAWSLAIRRAADGLVDVLPRHPATTCKAWPM